MGTPLDLRREVGIGKFGYSPRLGRIVIIGMTLSWLLGVGNPTARAGGPTSNENSAEGDLAIIVNTTNPVESMSLPELRKVFLGESSRWPNG